MAKSRAERAALLGWGDNSSHSDTGNSSFKYDSQTTDLVYKDNDRHLDGIGTKVKVMKEIAVQIKEEAVDSTKLLVDMDQGIDTTKGLILGSIHKVVDLKNIGTTRQMCYLVGAVVMIFLVLYLTSSWIFSSSPSDESATTQDG